MNTLYEYCDRLNSPVEAFYHISTPYSFPILPHWHYFVEIIHIIKGEVEATCGDYVYTLTPGDMLVFCPKIVHSLYELPEDSPKSGGYNRDKTASASPLQFDDLQPKVNKEHNSIYPVPKDNTVTEQYDIRYQAIKFDINFLNVTSSYKSRFARLLKLAFEKNPEYIYFSKQSLADIPVYDILDECIREVNNKCYGYDIITSSRLSMLLSYLSRKLISQGFDIDDAILADNDNTTPFDKITEYIDEHIGEQIHVHELAQLCGMSYSNFARLFRQTYHQTCKEYIEFIRLSKVADLLLYTKLDLNYISQETGFSDCSHLIRSFKKWKGTTPHKWREITRHKTD